MSRALLITGATGNQGGALINALLKAKSTFEIIAVSRDPTSASAQRLAAKSPNIKVIAGDLEKSDEMFTNAKKVTTSPIWGVYSVQSVGLSLFDEPETRQGKNIINSALKNNVKMFVYSSVDRGGDSSYDNPTNVPHFKTKHDIEHHLVDSTKNTDMSYTILRPVAFMGNLQPNFLGKGFSTMWNVALQKKPLQLIAASDIGVFAANAFIDPDEYRNRAISLAGDDMTFAQFKETFETTTGQPLPMTYRLVAWVFLMLSADMRLMFRWFGVHGYNVDVGKLRAIHPGLKSFEQWLRTESGFAEKTKSA